MPSLLAADEPALDEPALVAASDDGALVGSWEDSASEEAPDEAGLVALEEPSEEASEVALDDPPLLGATDVTPVLGAEDEPSTPLSSSLSTEDVSNVEDER